MAAMINNVPKAGIKNQLRFIDHKSLYLGDQECRKTCKAITV